MEEPPAAVFIQGQEPLTASMLAQAPPSEQKQMLGERLFPLIQTWHSELAGKITGMLLEIDNSELVHMLEHQESLKAKVEEAVVVLQAHKQQSDDPMRPQAAVFIQGQEPMEEPKTSEVAAKAVPEVQNDEQESSDVPAAAEDVAEKPDEPKDKEMDEGEKPAEASEPEKATSVEDTKASDAMETDPPAPDPVPDQEKAAES